MASERIQWHLRNQYYRVMQMKQVLANRYTTQNSIVLAGSPRSGTTWVAEVMANMPNTAHLDEPLKPNSSRYVRDKLGLGWYPSVEKDSQLTDAQKAFFERLLKGGFYNPNILFNPKDIALENV